MSVNSIRIDDSVKNEAVRIADLLGLSFNAVVEISLKQFNRNKGFSEPLRLEDELSKPYTQMTAKELERSFQASVQNRDLTDANAFVTMFDDSGRLYRQYDDGRVEYVLD